MAAPSNTSDAEARFCIEEHFTTSSKSVPKYSSMYTSSSTYMFPYLPVALVDVSLSIDDYYNHAINAPVFKNIILLDNDWNGYGAQKFDKDFVDSVRELVYTLNRVPKIFPTGRNSIQLEYKRENGNYIEFEIFPDNTVSVLTEKNGKENELDIQVEQLRETLDNFYAA